jgi:hypothetical protein
MVGFSRFIFGAALAVAAVTPALAGPRLSPGARLDKLIGDRVAGQPVHCINLRDVQSSQIIDGTAIVYRVGSKLYVNHPRSGARWLDDDDILATRTIGSQLCRIDTVKLIDRTARFQRGFVVLGDFVPYSRPR